MKSAQEAQELDDLQILESILLNRSFVSEPNPLSRRDTYPRLVGTSEERTLLKTSLTVFASSFFRLRLKQEIGVRAADNGCSMSHMNSQPCFR